MKLFAPNTGVPQPTFYMFTPTSPWVSLDLMATALCFTILNCFCRGSRILGTLVDAKIN